MTCEDCLHYELCQYNAYQEAHFLGKDKNILISITNHSACRFFKSNADFVEVVKCRDCVKDGRFDCPLCYIEKQTLQFVNHDSEFYCSYGKHKGGDEQ